MGILSSMFTGVSGINANGNALSVVGNNIANLNTVGFKSSRSVFADLISASLGGVGGDIQVGLGVALNGVQGNFSQGTYSTTSNTLDLAIDGNGFFTLRDQNGLSLYSRAGQFHLDAQSRIVDPSGFLLQGLSSRCQRCDYGEYRRRDVTGYHGTTQCDEYGRYGD